MRELKNIEEKILDRALYLIGKNGSSNVPIRAIAKEADVNVSAINYYFRTKEEMMKQVQEFYIHNTLEAYSILDSEEHSDEEKVMLCSNEIMEYALRYPGILVIQKEAAIEKEKSQVASRIIEVTQEMNEKLDKILFEVLKCSEENFAYHRMIFLSSILHPIINMDTLFFNNDIVNEKVKRLEYIKFVIKKVKNDVDIS